MKTLTVLYVATLALLLNCGISRAELILNIDTANEQINWLAGSSITRTPAEFDNNIFGMFETVDADILSPLLSYSGAGSHYVVSFDLSPDSSSIQGIALGTTLPPGDLASFQGTVEGPEIPTFGTGSFSSFSELTNGDYTLSPEGPWNGGIRVTVVPEPSSVVLVFLGSGVLYLRRKRFSNQRVDHTRHNARFCGQHFIPGSGHP